MISHAHIGNSPCTILYPCWSCADHIFGRNAPQLASLCASLSYVFISYLFEPLRTRFFFPVQRFSGINDTDCRNDETNWSPIIFQSEILPPSPIIYFLNMLGSFFYMNRKTKIKRCSSESVFRCGHFRFPIATINPISFRCIIVVLQIMP